MAAVTSTLRKASNGRFVEGHILKRQMPTTLYSNSSLMGVARILEGGFSSDEYYKALSVKLEVIQMNKSGCGRG